MPPEPISEEKALLVSSLKRIEAGIQSLHALELRLVRLEERDKQGPLSRIAPFVITGAIALAPGLVMWGTVTSKLDTAVKQLERDATWHEQHIANGPHEGVEQRLDSADESRRRLWDAIRTPSPK